MCGIVGWSNLKNNIRDYSNIMEEMIDTLKLRGPDSGGMKVYNHALIGHRRLSIVDPKGGLQPMTKKIGNREYTICYNGELYNTEEVREKLLQRGYTFDSYGDTEVLLTSYIEFGKDCVNYINGIFAFGIWDEYNRELFLCRDPLGIKPLFYSFKDGNLVFASEIKTLLKHPSIDSVVDKDGFLELVSLGPARNLGDGIFRDIKEVPPANYLIFNDKGVTLKEYWELEVREHEDDLEKTKKYVRDLLVEIIENQLVSDVPVCTFLSGGLDSSIISKVAYDAFERNGQETLNTFSIDYKDNKKFFKKDYFQPNSDSDYVGKMVDFLGSNHHNVVLNNIDLAHALDDATIAADLPGMADIDSSLLLFTREIRKDFVVGLSGECADEIFAGYPWFTNQDMINANTFPWSRSVSKRREILNSSLKGLDIEGFTNDQYLKTLKEVPHIDGEDDKTYRMREIFYLNLKWFMVNLLNRKDRTTMYNSLEVRVPFADHRIVDYAFNLPVETKLLDGREKGLLRKAFKGILPDEVLFRKKSPYPKTHNPIYTSIVCNMMNEILNDKTSPILEIIDRNIVQGIVESKGESYKTPWYGQLMTGPQLIAYLIQVNAWLKEYNVNLIL